MELHVNWGHASAQQLKQEFMDLDGNNAHLLTRVDGVLAQREVRQAFGKAPQIPVAEASTAAAFNKKLQVDVLPWGDVIASHVMDVFPKYSLLIPSRTKIPREVWGDFCNSWIGVVGPPVSIQMDEYEECENELRTDLRSDRRIKLLFQGVGARPWILERRNGFARGTYNRLKEDDQDLGKQIPAEVQRRLNALISGGGFSTNQMVFGSSPADLY